MGSRGSLLLGDQVLDSVQFVFVQMGLHSRAVLLKSSNRGEGIFEAAIVPIPEDDDRMLSGEEFRELGICSAGKRVDVGDLESEVEDFVHNQTRTDGLSRRVGRSGRGPCPLAVQSPLSAIAVSRSEGRTAAYP